MLFICAVLAAFSADVMQAATAQAPTLWIVGDSTANIGGDAAVTTTGRLGWGTPFAAYFGPAKIRVVNAAKAGRSSRTFLNQGLWARVLGQLRPGDIVLIQFGHNDPGAIDDAKARGSLHGIGDDTQTVTRPDGQTETVHTFGWYLRTYIHDTRSKGALPIVLSVTPRNIWTDGKVEMGLGHYREWAQAVAQAENTDYVDVTGIVARAYEKLGQAKVTTFFPLDHTHTDPEGAALTAKLVVSGLKALPDTPLTPYLSAEGRAVVSAAEANMALPANPRLHTLWIVGDSTVRNGQGNGANGEWGWGDEIAPFFNTDKINVVNRALGGRSSRTFYTFNWPTVLGMVRKGDFVIMQFGHNDSGPLDDRARARGTLHGNGPETQAIDNPITRRHEVVHTYGWYLRQMISEAQAKGAKVVVCSLIPRKSWEGDRIHREAYVQWAEAAASEGHAAFVNLNEIIAEQYEAMGQEKTASFFGDPHTHTNLAGARMNAEDVVAGLKGLKHDPLRKDFSAQGKSVAAAHPQTTAQMPGDVPPAA